MSPRRPWPAHAPVLAPRYLGTLPPPSGGPRLAASCRRAAAHTSGSNFGNSVGHSDSDNDGNTVNISRKYTHASIPCHLQVSVMLYKIAAVVPPSTLPTNNQFLRPIPMPRKPCSPMLLSISKNPCAT